MSGTDPRNALWRPASVRCGTFALLAFLLCFNSPGLCADPLRIATTALPTARGNPYLNIATTANFVLPAIFETLLTADNDGELHPALATSWRMTDSLTWEFSLAKDRVFSNGEPWNALAAKTIIDMARDEATPKFNMARYLRTISETIVIDEYTIQFKTHEPDAVLPRNLLSLYFVPPAFLADAGIDGLSNEPVGSGPYIVKNWTASRLQLERNPTASVQPRTDAVEFLASAETVSREQALRSGRVDVALAMNPDQIPMLESESFKIFQRQPLRVGSITFDTLTPGSPFRDERVRQAMNYAVNRDAIAKTLHAGLVEPASQAAMPSWIGYNPDLKPYPYDPEKAISLLNEAGYENGFKFIFEFPPGTLSNDSAIAQQVANDLAAIGVTMEIRPVPVAQFIKNIFEGGWQGYAWNMDYNGQTYDALRGIYRGSHSCWHSAPWFCDREIEKVVEAAGTAPTLEERVRLTQEVLRYYRDTAQSLLMFPYAGIDAVGPRIKHWEPWGDVLRVHVAEVD